MEKSQEEVEKKTSNISIHCIVIYPYNYYWCNYTINENEEMHKKTLKNMYKFCIGFFKNPEVFDTIYEIIYTLQYGFLDIEKQEVTILKPDKKKHSEELKIENKNKFFNDSFNNTNRMKRKSKLEQYNNAYNINNKLYQKNKNPFIYP